MKRTEKIEVVNALREFNTNTHIPVWNVHREIKDGTEEWEVKIFEGSEKTKQFWDALFHIREYIEIVNKVNEDKDVYDRGVNFMVKVEWRETGKGCPYFLIW